MNEQQMCEYCGQLLYRRGQVRFCSIKCAGLSRRKGKVSYNFSSDGKVGYGKLLTGEIFIFDSEDFPKIHATMWYH